MKCIAVVAAVAIAVVGLAIGQNMSYAQDHGFFQAPDIK